MTDREAFEAWAKERGWPLHKVSDSVYADRDTGNVWIGWQARGAQQEPVDRHALYDKLLPILDKQYGNDPMDDRVGCMNALIDFFGASPPAQPDAVPREPTPEMISVGYEAMITDNVLDSSEQGRVRRIYQAMIEAKK
jgi:hypothetical protein